MIYCEEENYKLYQGDMLEVLQTFKENSIDAIITDPPYEINFMNNKWDNSGIAFKKETWEQCLRVLMKHLNYKMVLIRKQNNYLFLTYDNS